MKHLRRGSFALPLIIMLLCAGCKTEKEKHVVTQRGTEFGVRIEVMLKGGGTAILVCPKFNSKPRGAHGRECYLDSYSKAGTAANLET